MRAQSCSTVPNKNAAQSLMRCSAFLKVSDLFRAADTTQKIADLRLRRGVKPQAVRKYDKAKQRRIKDGVSGSTLIHNCIVSIRFSPNFNGIGNRLLSSQSSRVERF